MKGRKVIFIAGLLMLLVTLLGTMYLYTKRQERSEKRYHLLCEVLRPGMSKDEVLRILRQEGEISVIGAESQSPNFDLHIVFTDPVHKELYRAFDLSFGDYKYYSAHITRFENSNVICNFLTPINR